MTLRRDWEHLYIHKNGEFAINIQPSASPFANPITSTNAGSYALRNTALSLAAVDIPRLYSAHLAEVPHFCHSVVSLHPGRVLSLRIMGSFIFHLSRRHCCNTAGVLVPTHRLSHHHIHLQLLASSPCQEDLLPHLKAQLAINDDIDVMRALKITRIALRVSLSWSAVARTNIASRPTKFVTC